MKAPGKWLVLLALAAIGLTTAVFTLRLRSAEITGRLSPATQTTGCEEESVYAVWRAAHGQAVYLDTSKIPFASAYFNWLFYYGYGWALRPLLGSHGDPSLQLYGRRLTAMGALLGVIILGGLCFAISCHLGPGPAAIAVVVGLSVFVGILPSWWSLTVRPDVWALACEAAGITWFLAFQRRTPTVSIVGAALLFFIAWSWKQTFVAGAGAAVMFLLLHQSWRSVLLMIVLLCALVAVPVIWLGESLRFALTETVTATGFDFGSLCRNSLAAGFKMLPAVAAVPVIVRAVRKGVHRTGARSLQKDALLFSVIGAAIALAIALPAVSKNGASTNYYFTAYLMLALAAISAASLLRDLYAFALMGAALIFLPILILIGRQGVTNLEAGAEEIAQRWAVWRLQPEPRFSADLRLNLPWLSPASPPLVLAFNYSFDRKHGRNFEAGGVGGLIRDGYFASLLLPSYVRGNFDGGQLKGYRPVQEVAGMTLYRNTAVLRPAGTESR